ncbi:MAG TPA: cytochrome c oxidase subunit 3 family protein [Terriglobales bacterium]|nr:cytochrome c oxidase subunit 3 family protein [Terriglobales bacterium]
MHRTGELFGQYQTLEQQKDSATLGMWIFLATEILFFGGLFLTYTVNRHAYPLAFGLGSNTLDIYLGTINTAVLIISSLTMAMAVWCAETDRKKLMPVYLMLTLIFGCAFLGIKFVEYKQKFDHHLVPGYNFDLRYHQEGPEHAAELQKAFEQDPGLNSHAQLYFSLYFGMTGLHALHMIVGVGLVFWLFLQSLKGKFSSRYNNPVENIGLYWHFVDIVWIYLYPLLYLIDRHLR